MSAYDAEGSLLYAIVARGIKVLAEYTNPIVRSGNHPRIALKILEKIPPQDSKMTYTYDNYNFHYEVSDEICFLLMADEPFSRVQSFKFITDVKKAWFEEFQDKGKTVKNAYAMNKTFKATIKEKMNYYNNDPQANKIKLAKDKISDIKDEMVNNIEKLLGRGEKLDILVDKTGDITDQSFLFKKKARNLKHAVFWNSVKLIVAIIFILLLVGIALFFYLCGGVKCIPGAPGYTGKPTFAPKVTATPDEDT